MTNSTATKTDTKTFTIRYIVTGYYDVEVERPADITKEELLNSVDRDELMSGEENSDSAWDNLKAAWREGDADIYDEDWDLLFED